MRALGTWSRGVAVAVVVAAVVQARPAEAQLLHYSGVLSGANESPPNASPGTGTAALTYNSLTHQLTVDVTFSGLLGNTTASHIHCCTAVPFAGTAGVATQVPTFTGFPLGVTAGSYLHTFDLTDPGTYNPAFLALPAIGGSVATAEATIMGGVAAGTAYLNIHSDVVRSGEIRTFFTATPEPGTYGLVATGLAGLAGLGWRRRRRA